MQKNVRFYCNNGQFYYLNKFATNFEKLFCNFKMMKKNTIKKVREGFQGQRQISVPPYIVKNFLSKDPITRQLFITHIGYYPKAKFHHVERPAGSNQNILIYCAEGSGWTQMDDVLTDISSSQFIIIPAKKPHSYGASDDNPWSIYWFHFQGEISEAIMQLILNYFKYRNVNITFNESRLQLFENIYDNLSLGYSNENLQYTNMVFYHFLSSLIFENKFKNLNKGDRDMIKNTIEYMAENVMQPMSLEDFANFANLSVSRFSTLFKIKTGYSPVDYFNHLKIQKACQYLLFTDYNIKEIGNKLGISDPYYFSRMFTKTMSLSPKKYRQSKIK